MRSKKPKHLRRPYKKPATKPVVHVFVDTRASVNQAQIDAEFKAAMAKPEPPLPPLPPNPTEAAIRARAGWVTRKRRERQRRLDEQKTF